MLIWNQLYNLKGNSKAIKGSSKTTAPEEMRGTCVCVRERGGGAADSISGTTAFAALPEVAMRSHLGMHCPTPPARLLGSIDDQQILYTRASSTRPSPACEWRHLLKVRWQSTHDVCVECAGGERLQCHAHTNAALGSP